MAWQSHNIRFNTAEKLFSVIRSHPHHIIIGSDIKKQKSFHKELQSALFFQAHQLSAQCRRQEG